MINEKPQEVLDFLVKCIKKGFLKKEIALTKSELEFLSKNEKLFFEMIEFHSIRLIISQVLNALNFESSITSKLRFFAESQTFYNLNCIHETKNLLGQFADARIPILPYKGNLFVSEFFNNSQLRESGDVDLLVLPTDFPKAINILRENGYNILLPNKNLLEAENQDIIFEFSNIFNEISFKKLGFALDVHWGLCYSYLYYNVDYNGMFSRAIKKDFYGLSTLIPSDQDIFFMIILHNGGKEFWFKMKHLVDLMAFLDEKGDNLNWLNIIEKSKEYHLYKIMIIGFYLIHNTFNYECPSVIVDRFAEIDTIVIQKIKKYWIRAKMWDTLWLRLKFEAVHELVQDEGFDKKAYRNGLFNSLAMPNIFENKRIVTFPKNWIFLNFVSKFLTYFYKSVFGKHVRN